MGKSIWPALILAFGILPLSSWAQAPYPGQHGRQPPAGPPGPAQAPAGAAQQSQQPVEYAFRPDLTNPEYGECLRMEKHWRALWQQYAALYQQVTMMPPSDPRYAQTAQYAQGVKQQLDAAWNQFSGKCVYFPPRR